MAAQRLFDQIKPERYCLSLKPDLEAFSYDFEETIEFELISDTTKLIWHGTLFELDSAQLDDNLAAAISFQPNDQTVTFSFDSPVAAGQHHLRLVGHGAIQDSLHGFYRSSYERDGSTQWLATTQFEPAHAREAFVCIDEPAAKAVFEIDITALSRLSVLSNGNETDHTRNGELTTHRFAPTPRMSTYLVAFIIGELEYAEQTTPEGVVVRVYATPGKKATLTYALAEGSRIISFYNDYFALPYPLPKLDMVAIPDFAAGAMENWGLVTYRENALIIDQASASLANRQRVTEVIAHELAHQWFGNLVTMTWWNDLWLNEGFATWVATLAMDHLYPEWQAWTKFILDETEGAFELDSLINTHPIEVEVEDPRELDEIFDAISYSKGGSVINMLHGYLGPERFRGGLRNYLAKHQYGNAVTSDLWAALGEASGEPVAELMASWTGRPGFPLVKVESKPDGFALIQQRFYGNPVEAKKSQSAEAWPIPLTALVGGAARAPELWSRLEKTIGGADAWLKLNHGQTGFYRTCYDQAAFARLLPLLAERSLAAIDRYGLANDVAAGAAAGYGSSVQILELAQALRSEPDYAVWVALTDGFGSLVGLASGTIDEVVEPFGQHLTEPNIARLGWTAKDGESSFDQLMRPLVIQQAGRYGNQSVIAEARRLFATGNDVPGDLRPAVYAIVARYGDTSDYEEFLKRFKVETNPQEQNRLLGSLARFRQPELTRRTLNWSLSEDVRPQDTIHVYVHSFVNQDAREQTWKFLQEKWPVFIERYGSGGHMLDHFIGSVGRSFSTNEKADEIERFFAANPHPAINRSVAQAVESTRLRAAWWERDGEAVTTWLTNWKPTG